MSLASNPVCIKELDAENTDYELLQRPALNISQYGSLSSENYAESEEEDGLIKSSSDTESDDVTDDVTIRNNNISDKKFTVLRTLQSCDVKKNELGNVWAKTMREEILNDEFSNFGFDRTDRSVETYNSRRINKKNIIIEECHSFVNSRKKNKKKKCRKRILEKNREGDSVKLKLCKISRKSKNIVPAKNDTEKHSISKRLPRARNLKDLSLDEGVTDSEFIEHLSECLFEKNIQLLSRAVKTLGRRRVIEFYNMTKVVEAAGGRTVKNGSRRRSSGGVFISIINDATDLTKAEKTVILTEPGHLEALKEKRKRQRKNRREKEISKRKNNENGDAHLKKDTDAELMDVAPTGVEPETVEISVIDEPTAMYE